MNCDQCDNEATVFLTEFSNGKVRKVSLCEYCAKERSVVDEATGLELSDLLWGLGNPDQKVTMENEGAEQDLLCPHCGFAESDFDKTERLGCPYCFGVFSERLSGMWKNFQSGAAHTGKRPRNADVLAAALANPPATAALPPTVALEKEPEAGPKETDKPRKKAKKALPEWEEPAAVKAAAPAETPASELSEFQKRIAELQAQMSEALREEAYEHAATLRDEIRDFERKIQDLETKRDRMQGKVANPTPAASHANISSGGPE